MASKPSDLSPRKSSSGQEGSKRGSAQLQPEDSPPAAPTTPLAAPHSLPSSTDAKMEMRSLENEKLRGWLEFVLRKNIQLREESEKISRDRDETRRNIEGLLSQNRQLTAGNTTMKEQLQRGTETIETLQKQAAYQEQRIQELKEENRMLNQLNSKTMRELKTIIQKKNELSKSCKIQRGELKKLAAEKRGDSTKVEQAGKRVTKMRADHQTATEQLEERRVQLKKYKDAAEELKAGNKQLQKMSSSKSSSWAVVAEKAPRDDSTAEPRTSRVTTKK